MAISTLAFDLLNIGRMKVSANVGYWAVSRTSTTRFIIASYSRTYVPPYWSSSQCGGIPTGSTNSRHCRFRHEDISGGMLCSGSNTLPLKMVH